MDVESDDFAMQCLNVVRYFTNQKKGYTKLPVVFWGHTKARRLHGNLHPQLGRLASLPGLLVPSSRMFVR